MPRSTQKSILFAVATHDKRRHIDPVAVFVSPASAKAHAMKMHAAYVAKDGDAIKRLFPKTRLTDDGTPVMDVKLSLANVPYEPAEEAGDTSFLTEDEPLT